MQIAYVFIKLKRIYNKKHIKGFVMLVLLIISFILCFGYIAFVGYSFSVASISASYYKFEEKRKGLGILFLLWTIATSVTLLPCWLWVTHDKFKYLIYISALSLILVGFFPDYQKKHCIYHPLFNLLSFISAIVWCMLFETWFIPIILMLFVFIYSLIRIRCKISIENLASVKTLYWIEISALLGIYSSIFIYLFYL